MWLSDQQSACASWRAAAGALTGAEIGVGLVSAGVFFLFLGVVLFFDATLLALGNVLVTAGIALLIGPQKTFYFFARRQKIRGTVCFFLGMILVFLHWTLIGMFFETIGFLNLFGYVCSARSAADRSDFFPVILNFLRQVPVLGDVLTLPVVGQVRTAEPTAGLTVQVLDQVAGVRRSAV